MAKMTVKEEPVKPPLTITLELNVEEAAVLAKLCGHVCGGGEFRNVAEYIGNILESNSRISRLCEAIQLCDTINASYVKIPKEQ